MNSLDLLRYINLATSIPVVIAAFILIYKTIKKIRISLTEDSRSTGAVLLSLYVVMATTGIMNIIYLTLVVTNLLTGQNQGIVGNLRLIVENISAFFIILSFLFIQEGKL